MRSLALGCPGCGASYDVWFSGSETPALRCRLCRSPLRESGDEASGPPPHSLADADPALMQTRPACGELRVWLDDDLEHRGAPEGWIHVVTAWDAIELLRTGRVVALSLDHELGDAEGCGRGLDAVAFLREEQVVRGRILWPRDGLTIHTRNPDARERMAHAIRRCAGRAVIASESLSPNGELTFRFDARSS